MHADKLPISGLCPIDLDAIGFDRKASVSHCSHCTKSVHILSNMSRGEAIGFLRENRGQKLCVSYARDEEGRVRFRPEPRPMPALVPVARLRSRPSRAAGFVAALGVSATLAACTPHGDDPGDDPGVVDRVVQVDAPRTPPEAIETPPPEEVMAGMMMVPEEMVDGEMEVPDVDAVDLDQPCDRGGDKGANAFQRAGERSDSGGSASVRVMTQL